jgi:hypothetical protein
MSSGFPPVKKATPERARHFGARLNDDKHRHALAWWGEQFEYMSQSAFLCERAKAGAPWLNFDWILNEDNLVKIVERKFGSDAGPPQKRHGHKNQSLVEYMQEMGDDPLGFGDAVGGGSS